MGKYDPLGGQLRRIGLSEFELSFLEIERIIGGMLPNSAQDPQWWANVSGHTKTHVQAKAWLENGYEAFLIRGADRVKFVKADESAARASPR